MSNLSEAEFLKRQAVFKIASTFSNFTPFSLFYTGLEDYDDEIKRARKKYVGSQRKKNLKKKNLDEKR